MDISSGKVRRFVWTHEGKRRESWGYTVDVAGRQVRRQGWNSKFEAQDALDAYKVELRNPQSAAASPAPSMTFAEAVERYAKAQARRKSIVNVKRHLNAMKLHFGADTPLSKITGAKISAWKDARLGAICLQTKRPYSAAAVNRPLAALRHLLRLARDEWEVLDAVPKIRTEREPQGRMRWLEPDEEARLLDACAAAKNAELLPLVTLAIETGARRGELLGLTWDRVDMTRGVIRLEETKSGKRRDVPMRQSVYNTLAALPEPHEGRVFRTRSIRNAYERAVVRAKLSAPLRFHDLRHSFASWFVMRGGRVQALQAILGHADIKMTLRYAHLAPDHLRNEMAATERKTPAAVSEAAMPEVEVAR